MKTLFRILGTAAAVAVTGAAIVALDKILNQKDPLHVEKVEFPEEAEQDAAEAEKTAEAYAEAEAKAADDAAEHSGAPAEGVPGYDCPRSGQIQYRELCFRHYLSQYHGPERIPAHHGGPGSPVSPQ